MPLDEYDVPITYQVAKLKEKLSTTESPFTWMIDIKENIDPNLIIGKYCDKINYYEFENSETKFQLNLFLYHLILCYQYTRVKDLITAKIHFIEAQNLMKFFDEDHFLWDSNDAIQHLLNSSKAYLYLHRNLIDKTIKTLNSINFKEQMNKENYGTLLALKALCISFDSLHNLTKCIKIIKEAQNQSPNQLHWTFLEGWILRKHRKTFDPLSMPQNEEIDAFHKAYSNDCNHVSYCFYLSSSLIEKGKMICFPQKSYLFRQAESIMKKLINRFPDSLNILQRSAECFLKMPFKENQLQAKAYLEKIIQIQPKNYKVYDLLGYYHEFILYDYNKAMFFYERAAQNNCVHAWINIFRCKYILDNNYNPIEDLNILIKKINNLYERGLCFLELGWWFIIIEHDIKKAIYEWANALELHSYLLIMNFSKPKIILLNKEYKICEIMFDEIEKYLKSGNVDSGRELDFFESIKKKIMGLDESFRGRVTKTWLHDIEINLWKFKNPIPVQEEPAISHWSL